MNPTEMLTRDQFCILTKVDSENLKNRGRRNTLPFTPLKKRNAYTSHQAFLLIMCDHLARDRSLSMSMAVTFIANIAPQLKKNHQDILRTVKNWGQAPEEDIFGARIQLASEPALFTLGSWPQVAAIIPRTEHPLLALDIVNASQGASVLQSRASLEEIDIADFWKDEQ